MRRGTSELSEVAWSIDNPFAEMVHPNTVYERSYEEWVRCFGVGQPFCESESSTACRDNGIISWKGAIGSFGNQDRELCWRDFAGWLIVITAMKEFGCG